MTLAAPSAEYQRLVVLVESAVDDPVRLRALKWHVARGGLPAAERSDLLTRAGQYIHGCCPEPLELFDE